MASNNTDDCKEDIHVPTAEELRLQKNLEPIFYNLTLKIYVPGYVPLPTGKDFTFDGDLQMKFKVKKPTKKIELNSLNLDFPTNLEDYHLSTTGANSTKSKVIKITVEESLQKVFFELDNQLENGKEYEFQFRYSGNIRRQLAGLYLTTYRGSNGQDSYAAVTQMAPADARKMVPCFDEPEFKAVWKIKVHHPKGTRAASNAIEVLEKQQDP
uniref:Aminopeptidase N-like N-terminal domain-containing protein n=1 Tax=Panagrolaimus sp. JU765 TaxID=591449 RepID=A0AC34R3K1_9BILA